MKIILTEEELNEKCKEWQKILGLRDWDIEEVSVQRERNIGDNFGEVRTNLEQKWARISLMDPIDHDPMRHVPYDMEETLVHELIHLHFEPFIAKEGTPELIAHEQVINVMSKALVNLKRRNYVLRLPPPRSSSPGSTGC